MIENPNYRFLLNLFSISSKTLEEQNSNQANNLTTWETIIKALLNENLLKPVSGYKQCEFFETSKVNIKSKQLYYHL